MISWMISIFPHLWIIIVIIDNFCRNLHNSSNLRNNEKQFPPGPRTLCRESSENVGRRCLLWEGGGPSWCWCSIWGSMSRYWGRNLQSGVRAIVVLWLLQVSEQWRIIWKTEISNSATNVRGLPAGTTIWRWGGSGACQLSAVRPVTGPWLPPAPSSPPSIWRTPVSPSRLRSAGSDLAWRRQSSIRSSPTATAATTTAVNIVVEIKKYLLILF